MADIEAHCIRTGDTPSAVTRRVLGDSKAWGRMQAGKDIYHRNFLKLKTYLDGQARPKTVIEIVKGRGQQRQRERHPENVNGNA